MSVSKVQAVTAPLDQLSFERLKRVRTGRMKVGEGGRKGGKEGKAGTYPW
jgi:hypothetical protein